jgi:hypothetical protein
VLFLHVQAVSAYVVFITGMGFMPIFDNLVQVMAYGFTVGR